MEALSITAKTKNSIKKLIRFINNFKRPSKRTNSKLLQQRGKTMNSFIIREAIFQDLPALADLHVKTWNETYPNFRRPPTYEIREQQWREQFSIHDGNWFCFIIENSKKELIGFAKGKRNADNTGIVDKIYLLRQYQRLGLGRKLMGQVAHQFVNMGVKNISLFGVPENPSCYFHEAIGGERLYTPNGEFQGGYIWRDLQKLISLCSFE